MKRKLLFILICLMEISNVNAQFSAGSLYFGYCDDNEIGATRSDQTAEFSAAICMPASISSLYAGKTITKIRIGLMADCTNVSVWIRNSLDGPNLISQTVGNTNWGWTEVTLSTPFTIQASDLYIGYTATGYHQTGFSGNVAYDGCWLGDNNGWGNFAFANFGSLCIQALIDAQGATVLAAEPESLFKTTQSPSNQDFTVQGSIKSYSSVDITSVKVSYQIDNQASVEKTIQTSIAPMKSGTIQIPINAIAVNGVYQLSSVKILEINGQPNAFFDKSLNAEIRIFSRDFPRKVVTEVKTTTWNGFSIKEIVRMESMKEKYPETFIGIAVQADGPMAVRAYSDYMGGNYGYPVVDRKKNLTGDADNVEICYLSEMEKPPVASIQLTGDFTDAYQRAITLKTVTTFGFSSNSANFKLAYVILENGVTGYSQANAYAGGEWGPMGGYENKPNPVTDMVFNNIARGIYSEPTGILGSIPASITEMTPIEHTYTINLPLTIQKGNLEVVVMLINGDTGEIENANKIKISDEITLPVLFGYSEENISNRIGNNLASELSAAICIPASVSSLYAGKIIPTIRIQLASNCTNVSVWIRNSLDGPNLVSQTVGDANWGWIEVPLPAPFTIPASDFYIGYTATGPRQVGFSGVPVYNGCWVYDNQWNNLSDHDLGSLCIQAVMYAKGETVLAAELDNLPKSVEVSPNQDFSIQASVKSFSTIDITSVKVSCQIDNQTPVEKTFHTSIAAMKRGTIDIPIDAIAKKGIYNLSFKILEINGQPNALADNSANLDVRILSDDFSFQRKVVMEEGTGNWNGWCIGGIVKMTLMKEKYPETFIGIAVHHSDPMAVEEYDTYMTANFIKNFPEAVIDRKKNLIGNPYYDFGGPYYNVENFYLSEIAKPPIASIQLTGGFTDADKKAIALKTVTTFGVPSHGADFRLAYVLIENGVTGYDQANAYAGASSYYAMGGFEKRPNPVTDMVFANVARGIYSDPTGILGSIPVPIIEMTPMEHHYTIDLPASIQNKDNLRVVVMLLNPDTGEIENADETAITGVFSNIPVLVTGAGENVYISGRILYIESNVSETIDIYTTSGVKVYNTTKTPGVITVSGNHLSGNVLIVKGSSGWVKKVIR